MKRLVAGLTCVVALHSPAAAFDDLPASSAIIECAVFWHVVADGAERQGLPLGNQPAIASKMLISAGFELAKVRGESVDALSANMQLMLGRMSAAAFDQDKLIALAIRHRKQCDAIEAVLIQILRDYQRK